MNNIICLFLLAHKEMVGDVDIVDKGARETYGYIQTSIQTYVIYGYTYHTHTRIR